MKLSKRVCCLSRIFFRAFKPEIVNRFRVTQHPNLTYTFLLFLHHITPREPHACNDDDNSISAIDSCLDRDRPRDVSPAAREDENTEDDAPSSFLAPRSLSSSEKLHPIFGARVLSRCTYVRETSDFTETSIRSPCNTVLRIR